MNMAFGRQRLIDLGQGAGLTGADGQHGLRLSLPAPGLTTPGLTTPDDPDPIF